jgi:hypothetical protein
VFVVMILTIQRIVIFILFATNAVALPASWNDDSGSLFNSALVSVQIAIMVLFILPNALAFTEYRPPLLRRCERFPIAGAAIGILTSLNLFTDACNANDDIVVENEEALLESGVVESPAGVYGSMADARRNVKDDDSAVPPPAYSSKEEHKKSVEARPLAKKVLGIYHDPTNLK